MNNESEFQAFKRHFLEKPNDELVFCADDLYRQASGSVLRGALWGGIGGLLFVTIVYLVIVATGVVVGRSGGSIHEFVAALGAFKPSPIPWLFGAVTGGGWGYRLGERSEVRLRAVAKMALALAHVEAKLSKLEESGKPPENDSQSPSQSAL
jgi:hypothetical protein